MSNSFEDYAKYYDLIYADKDYEAEVKYFAKLIGKNETRPTRKILEFGAGTGKHQEEFRKLGYAIEGVEPSDQMVTVGLERGATIHRGEFQTFQHPDKFDAVLALFHVVSYITRWDELVQAFRNARGHLTTGGLFVFDTWFEGGVTNEGPSIRLKRAKNSHLEVLRIAEPREEVLEKVVTVDYSIFVREATEKTWGMIQETHSLRFFSLAEIQTLAELSEFYVAGFEETYSGLAASPTTWGLSTVLLAK